jgi:hypothetical protein
MLLQLSRKAVFYYGEGEMYDLIDHKQLHTTVSPEYELHYLGFVYFWKQTSCLLFGLSQPYY